MIAILDHLHQYVPSQSISQDVEVPGCSESFRVHADYFHHILFGDLLTAKRAKGGKSIRSNSERGRHGLLPVCEYWHAKVCLLAVSIVQVMCFTVYSTVYVQLFTIFAIKPRIAKFSTCDN